MGREQPWETVPWPARLINLNFGGSAGKGKSAPPPEGVPAREPLEAEDEPAPEVGDIGRRAEPGAERLPRLLKKARGMPAVPGVYLMKDAAGVVLYVGKAARLPDRVS